MVSLIIPTTSSSKKYTDNILKNINELYPNRDEVEIVVEENDNVSLGINYNNAIAKAKGEIIVLLHNDMILAPGFIENIIENTQKGRILTYTRVEPPIYNDIYPGKEIQDYGRDIEDFNSNRFLSYLSHVLPNYRAILLDGGSQLFFSCLKEDYIGIDGYTFQKFCEDDDIHLRYKLLGFEHKVTMGALVYHFVSKTSRNPGYQEIERQSNINFVRKWGFRNSKYHRKYDIGFIINNCSEQILEALEPWCSTIYINPYYKLSNKIRPYDETKKNDILIKFDASSFGQNQFTILQNISDIIYESEGATGSFNLDIFEIDIINNTEYQNNLIYLFKDSISSY